MSEDDHNQDAERLLREMLMMGEHPLSIPPARHKRFARRAMRRKKSAQWTAAHQRASIPPVTQSHRIPLERIQSLPQADLPAEGEPLPMLRRMEEERERHAQTIHRLRKEASDAKRELRFLKSELRRTQEREEKVRNENLRLQTELLDLQTRRARDRTASDVLPKTPPDERDRTGSES